MKQIKHGIITFLIIGIFWQLVITVLQINPALFPSPAGVGKAFAELVTVGLKGSTSGLPLISHVSISLIRFFIAECILILIVRRLAY